MVVFEFRIRGRVPQGESEFEIEFISLHLEIIVLGDGQAGPPIRTFNGDGFGGAVGTESELLNAYELHGILGPKFRNDMLHIAIATLADVDVVVSWNLNILYD
jgi:hypothetical protein